jgi:hypothetical protein
MFILVIFLFINFGQEDRRLFSEMLCSHFCPEYGGSIFFFWNVGNYVSDYTTSHLRRMLIAATIRMSNLL